MAPSSILLDTVFVRMPPRATAGREPSVPRLRGIRGS